MMTNDLPTEFLDSLELEEAIDIGEAITASLGHSSSAKLDARSMQRAIKILKMMDAAEAESGGSKWFPSSGMYSIWNLPKHKAFFDAGFEYPERLFMAGNRVGKSLAGAYELTCHLTGVYPDWWEGRKFDRPIQAWAAGKDARAVRDTAQRELLGPVGEWGTGMLPAHTLGKAFALQGTPQAIDILKVKHISGGWSELGFKNYQQDIGSFMGTSRDVIWLDEECPLDIYNECNIRLATSEGMMLVTFTPLDGLTRMVVNFCKRADFLVGSKPIVAVETEESARDEDGEGEYLVGRSTPKAVVQAGWDDAPWLTESIKARLLEDTPLHLRKARSTGEPAMGSGNVYPVPIEDILIEPFAIPEAWPRMFALDVGWNRTAALWGALDPATDTLYIYDEHYLGQEIPAVHGYAIKSRGEWIHGVIDPAARGRSQRDGERLIDDYKELGLILFKADNEVESGLQNTLQRLVSRRIKVFKTCINFQKEYLLYRRDKNGKVVKEDDHLMDCLRYIVNNMKRMISKSEIKELSGIKYAKTAYDI
jgi:phage terminase large subunit-like protein